MAQGKVKLITAYHNPDLDGFACAVAYQELLEKQGTASVIGIDGQPQSEARYLMDTYGFTYPGSIADWQDYDQIILVDASDTHVLHNGINAEHVVEVIDHRKVQQANIDFPNAQIQIELVGAAATLIAEKFEQANITPSRMSAVLLYGAIASNTLNFKANVTTDRDHAMAAWLKTQTDIPDTMVQDMFIAKSDFTGDKLKTAINGIYAWYDLGEKRFQISQLELIGAQRLLDNRMDEILFELHRLNKELNLDQSLLTISELKEGRNYYVTDEPETQQLLSDLLGVTFNDNVAIREGLLMRKELVALLKEYLEVQA